MKQTDDELDKELNDEFQKALIELQFKFDEINKKRKWYCLTHDLYLTDRDKSVSKFLFNKGYRAGVEKMLKIYEESKKQ
jgi:hypothetical protein